jgi:hypothetical protein
MVMDNFSAVYSAISYIFLSFIIDFYSAFEPILRLNMTDTRLLTIRFRFYSAPTILYKIIRLIFFHFRLSFLRFRHFSHIFNRFRHRSSHTSLLPILVLPFPISPPVPTTFHLFPSFSLFYYRFFRLLHPDFSSVTSTTHSIHTFYRRHSLPLSSIILSPSNIYHLLNPFTLIHLHFINFQIFTCHFIFFSNNSGQSTSSTDYSINTNYSSTAENTENTGFRFPQLISNRLPTSTCLPILADFSKFRPLADSASVSYHFSDLFTDHCIIFSPFYCSTTDFITLRYRNYRSLP